VLLLVVATAIVVPLRAADDHALTVATPGGHPAEASYVPATTTRGGLTQMPITLPDGRPFTVRYASELDLAKLGFQSTVGATLFLGGNYQNTQARTLDVLHTTAAQRYRGLAPVATYPDANGTPVPYYVDPASPERGGLAVQIGSWLVVVPDLDDPTNHPDDHLTPDQAAAWAQNLGGWIDAAGFPVIAPGRALQLDEMAKSAFVLGPTSTSKDNVGIGERWLCEGPGVDTTTPRRFPPTPRGAAKGAAWCDKATGLHVAVVGTQRFVNSVIDSFHIAPFSTAPRATRILLPDKTMEAGSSIPGVVVVVNNTGAPLTYGGCGGLFQVALTQGGASSGGLWLTCLMQITVPEGESVQPVNVMAAEPTCSGQPICPLAAGRYEAVLAQNTSDFPAATPVRVRVVPPS
jgi:hypothetical protein